MNFVKGSNAIPRILLVEDNHGDIRLTKEALKESAMEFQLDVVTDGEQALDFLHKRNEHKAALSPNLILLDLNLPKKNGIEVLREVKTHEILKKIPVIILTTSDSKQDITNAYALHANCYILKPDDFDDFAKVINLIGTYWFQIVELSED